MSSFCRIMEKMCDKESEIYGHSDSLERKKIENIISSSFNFYMRPFTYEISIKKNLFDYMENIVNDVNIHLKFKRGKIIQIESDSNNFLVIYSPYNDSHHKIVNPKRNFRKEEGYYKDERDVRNLYCERCSITNIYPGFRYYLYNFDDAYLKVPFSFEIENS